MIHTFLKYSQSHIYEIHAFLAGSIVFVLMFWLKKPIKRAIRGFVEQKGEINPKWKDNKEIYIRRFHILLILLDFVLAAIVFSVLSVISPMIHFSKPMLWLSGVAAVSEYAIYEQLFGGRKKVDYE